MTDPALEGLLQQLRDIQEPPIPGFWPPAIGWWIVATLLLIAILILAALAIRHWLRVRPYWAIRHVADDLLRAVDRGEVDDGQFLQQVNALYKRLLIVVEHRSEVARQYDDAWLHTLRDRFNNDEFVYGSGLTLGTARYMPTHVYNKELIELVRQTLCKVSPP